MALVQGQQIFTVDNDTAGQFYAGSDAWGVSSWNSQRFGSLYRYTEPAPVQQSASYKFDLPASGYYEVYAWYPSHPQYNSQVRVTIWHVSADSQTEVGTPVYLDQRSNGERWVYLGSFPMQRGNLWRVQVSWWSSKPGYIIADAFRLVRR